MNDSFGIYILTYPGDYHLSKVLIQTLNYFHKDLPITIIPGSGFDLNDHPFDDVPVLHRPTDARMLDCSDYDRKFWCFSGPYERFLYIDADIICLRSIDQFIQKVKEESGVFFYANLPFDGYGLLPDGSDNRKMKAKSGFQLGHLALIEKFDPEYDYLHNYLFNSGLFASSKKSLRVEDILNFQQKEKNFIEEELGQEFSSRRLDQLFYGDQGKLNYLVYKLNIPLKSLHPHAHYLWGGESIETDLQEVLEGTYHTPFIHWAGCPKPSLSIFNHPPFLQHLMASRSIRDVVDSVPITIPAANVWQHFNEVNSLKKAVSDSLDDLRKFILPYAYLTLRSTAKKVLYTLIGKN